MGFVFISTKLVYIFIKQVICIILAIHSKFKQTLIYVPVVVVVVAKQLQLQLQAQDCPKF